MPTGYTCDIPNGIDFKTYALNCARAFGACVELRDEPFGGDKIPDSFEPSDYHLKEAKKLREELDAHTSMSDEELAVAAAKEWESQESHRLEMLGNIAKQRAAYEAMLEKVKAWTPPTPGHEALKTFMQDQIEQSIKFDCYTKYYETPAERPSWLDWAGEQRQKLEADLEYHEKKYEEEKKRAANQTAWVRALRASL